MDAEGNLLDKVPKMLKKPTDISTGIGPTGTDTPAPKELLPQNEQMEHSLEEPLCWPRGALFEVGSGTKREETQLKSNSEAGSMVSSILEK